MVELDPHLSQVIKVYRNVLEVPATGTTYRALSAEAFTKEGLNPHKVIFDEVHAQRLASCGTSCSSRWAPGSSRS